MLPRVKRHDIIIMGICFSNYAYNEKKKHFTLTRFTCQNHTAQNRSHILCGTKDDPATKDETKATLPLYTPGNCS